VAVQDQLTLPWRVQRLKQRLVSLEVQFADVRGYRGEHESLENQAAIGV
jgi:hypothetical protein